MAIKKQFGGSTIKKPGAYSRSLTNPSGGSATPSTGIMLLIGEADAGPGGASDGIQSFSAQAFNKLKAKYRSGPLVDAAKAALSPSRTPGVNGAGTFLIYKTNASTQAELDLANTYATVKALEYGVGGNRITYKNTLSAESEISLTGSAAVTNFAGLDGLTLEVRQNGAASETVTFSSPANIADVISQIESGTTGISATEASAVLTLTVDAGTNLHRNGYGRSLEIVGGTALSLLFLSIDFATPEDEPTASFEIIQPRDSITETKTVGGDIALQIGRDDSDSCTAATVAVTSSQVTLTATGSDSYALTFEDYPLIGNLVDAINELAGWSASCPSTYRVLATSDLDIISAIGAYSEAGEKPARIKKDAKAVADFFSESVLVEIADQATKGLPDQEGRLSLASGARGASTSSNFDAGFSAALAKDCNVILPCISQDASADITAGLTDAASTYDIEAVQAMLSTHIGLRGNIKNRKEAQGWTGYRKQAKADVFSQAATLGTAEIQMCMEDVLVVDSTNELKWKQPHIMAALMAGIRLGTEVGEPLTHKFLAVQGVGHYVNTSTGVVQGDYDPQTDFEEAIDAGVTSSEPDSGGWRVMVDNTTYGADENFVYNRGSVIEAAQYIAKYIRGDAEKAFIGRKNAVVTAAAIKSRIKTRLGELLADRITSPSIDAPLGFVEESFIVEVNGNTAEVQLEVKPVQGLDFIFVTFTLGDTQQSA